MTLDEFNKSKVDSINAMVGTMDGVDCPLCKNKGYIAVFTDNAIRMKDCECLKARRSKKFMDDSGLSAVFERYNFNTYNDDYSWQKAIKDNAINFCNKDNNSWYMISGRPGSGKTHICTAICDELIKKNHQVRYMMWRTDATFLKMNMKNTDEYSKKMNEFCSADVLYIDDFWKGEVTQADINLAFDLLNYRYMSNTFATIISSELSIESILDIDEAIGSRILQRSKGYRVKTNDVNMRF